jgi:hypothetical protein
LRLRRTLKAVWLVGVRLTRLFLKEQPPFCQLSFGRILVHLAVSVVNRKLLPAVESEHYAFYQVRCEAELANEYRIGA